MARIRELQKAGGKTVTGWTPRKGGRPPTSTLWEVTVSIGRDADGRWRQRTERVRGTYTAAKAAATQMEARYGNRSPEADRTVTQALDAYIAHRAAIGRAPKTIAGYRSLAATISGRLGTIRLARFTPTDLDGYYRWLGEARGLAPTTVHHHHRLIAQVLKYAAELGWLNLPTAADRAHPPSLDRPEPTSPTPSDVRQLAGAVVDTNPDMAALLTMAALTGCRRGEVCAWKWSDFDPETGQLTVRRAISDAAGSVTERTTKTGRRRRLAIDANGAAIMADHWDRYTDKCRLSGITPDRSTYVFSQAGDHTVPWRPDRVTHTFGRLRAREARRQRDELGGVDGERAYERIMAIRLGHFRHFSATEMLGAGVDIRTASARLGHDGAVMLRHYAGVIGARDQAAADLLGELLAGTD